MLLHRPFVQYDQIESGAEGRPESMAHFTSLSRAVCVDNASQIVEILEQYRAHFDLAQIYGTVAATLLPGFEAYTDTYG